MIPIIYSLNMAILLSTVLDFRTKAPDRLFLFSIVRVFFILPSLIGTYLFTYNYTEPYVHPFFFNSENVFSLLWMVLSYRLFRITYSSRNRSLLFRSLFSLGTAVVTATAGYAYFDPSSGAIVDGVLVFSHYGTIYCSAFFLLVAVLILSWRLEAFWRSLDTGERWRYKYLTVGLVLVCAMLGWSTAYRLAYLRLPQDHLLLLAIILIIAFVFMGYALARHRMLNRKMFVSRKVVYATVTPIVFSSLFIILGIMALLSRLFGWTVPFFLQWFVVISGILGITVLALSERLRRHARYFISTHFYVNKYEYRDEWLAFSDLLQGKLSEKGVVEALYQILRDSMYTHTILIWLGDIQKGFRLINSDGDHIHEGDDIIAGDDPIVCYLLNAPYLYSHAGDSGSLRRSIFIERHSLLQTHDVVLLVPLILGNQFVGLIGLGPETTGGLYGHDDFDLLLALSSHAASALLAVQNAEKLARTSEQLAYSNISAFVLHDIKNAATMLDLVRKNAPKHMDNPEFQQDMLASIDDALNRMTKVQTRLSALRGEITPTIRPVQLDSLLRSCCDRFSKKLDDLHITVECPGSITVETDPEFIARILENLLINAKEAGAEMASVVATVNDALRIEIADNGPGIMRDLLPRGLFEPFKTGKPMGSGIGLWQVRQLVAALGGEIHALNAPNGVTLFVFELPIQ